MPSSFDAVLAAAQAAATSAQAAASAAASAADSLDDLVDPPPRVATILHSSEFPSVAAFFAARNAIAGPAVMVFAPLSSHVGANLRIDQPDTIIQGNGATITLPPGNNQDGILVGTPAFRLRIQNLNLAGAYATQTGTSRGIVFEEYVGQDFRFADRSAVVDCNIDGFLTDGIVVKPMRKNVIVDRTFVRDFGRYGLDLSGPDCRAIACNFGGIRGQYGVRINQSTAWVSECGIYSCTVAGILLTNLALGPKIINNDIDNNYGAGLRAVGVSNDAIRGTIQGNHFRSNSSAGDGLHPDIYMEQVSFLVISGNYFYNQTGSAWRVTYAIDAGAGISSIAEFGNGYESAHHTTGRMSTTAKAGMTTRFRRLDFSDDGMSDSSITRVGTDPTLQISGDVQIGNTLLTPRVSMLATDGTGVLRFAEQTVDPAAPSANQARLFARDNGSGKTQLCIRFATGAVQVIATEP